MTAGTELLAQAEYGRLLMEWNATDRPYPTDELLHEPFERQARLRPDAVAVVRDEEVLSYRALNSRAEHWARRLREAGCGPEVIVGVHLPRSTELVAVLLGVLKAGGAYLPLDPAHSFRRLEAMAEQARMAVLVTDSPEIGLGNDAIVLEPAGQGTESDRLIAPSSPHPGTAATPDNLAYVLFTSGSTGRPKGAAITHANASDLLYWCGDAFGEALDRVLATTSICFDCSIMEIFAPLCRGGTVVLADDAFDIATRSARHDVQLMHSVPSVMAELVRLGPLPPTLSTVVLGGERLWQRLVDDVHSGSHVRHVVNVYGPTECTSYSTWAVIAPRATSVPSIGRPVANTQIYLLDPGGRPTALGDLGEIYVGGRGPARGYLHAPGLTAERFLPDPFAPVPGGRWYRTGDLARFDESGVLTFVGRVDDQVKVRGVRVEPAEVEQALLHHPSVAEAAVIAPHDGPGRRQLRAFVVPAPSSLPPSDNELRKFLQARMSAPLVPDVFTVVERLPRTPNGKVDRRRLAAELPAPRVGDGEASARSAPADEIEARLASIWADALERDGIGVHDDFYALGGQSLAAMRISAMAEATLGIELPVELILTQRTVASLAAEVRGFAALAAVAPQSDASCGTGTRARLSPLSPSQRAIWTWARRDPADPGLNLPVCVRIVGPFLPAALIVALTQLVHRHEVLRSLPRENRNGGLQEVQPLTPMSLPLVDLSELPAAAQVEQARDLSFLAGQAPFDLARAPILHARLFRLAADDHVLALTLHQLVGDVWSMGTAGRQLLELYLAAATATAPRSLPGQVQYGQWAQRQVEWLDSAAGQRQRGFWRDRLADVPVLTLWPDAVRMENNRTSSAGHEFLLSGELIGGLTDLASRENATLHVVLLAAYQLLLGHWSGQDDVIVGCPTAGRVGPNLAATIGSFVNALVMRADLAKVSTFRELARQTRDEAWTVYAHQDVPFAQIVADLGADHDLTRHPIYQASATVHYLETEPPRPAGLAVSDFGRRPPPRTALDLELTVYVGPAGAECGLTYREDLARAEDVARFAENYVSLLQAAVADPDLRTSDLASVLRRV